MMNPTLVAALLEVPGAAAPGHLLAYIGPGAGLGALILTIALVLGVVLLLIGLVWYPLKRVLGTRAADAGDGSREDEPG